MNDKQRMLDAYKRFNEEEREAFKRDLESVDKQFPAAADVQHPEAHHCEHCGFIIRENLF